MRMLRSVISAAIFAVVISGSVHGETATKVVNISTGKDASNITYFCWVGGSNSVWACVKMDGSAKSDYIVSMVLASMQSPSGSTIYLLCTYESGNNLSVATAASGTTNCRLVKEAQLCSVACTN